MSRKGLAFLGLAGLVLAPILVFSLITGPPQMPTVALTSGETPLCTMPAPKGGGASAIGAHAYRAGFRGEDVTIAVAVARAESGWNEKATNRNSNGSVDYGLMQINSIHEAILAGGNWADAGDNMVMARKVFTDAGSRWTPWVTYNTGSYRQFLDDVAVKPVCTQPVATACPAPKDLDRYGNGQIPQSALCTLWADRRHRLRSDAAGQFDLLAKAFKQRFAKGMCITDSYRSYAEQVDVFRRKPGLAAVPGTSNHGWGLALDLCAPGGGQWVPGSDYDRWMHQQGKAFGWVHPSWAHAGGSRPEPWHFGFPVKGHRP